MFGLLINSQVESAIHVACVVKVLQVSITAFTLLEAVLWVHVSIVVEGQSKKDRSDSIEQA